MTKQKSGASQPVMESYQVLLANKLAVTTTAQPLMARPNPEAFTCIVQASHANTSGSRVLVGNQHNQTFELEPGEAVSIPASPFVVYVRVVSGTESVNWLAGG
jgi:hypothetical protein